MRQGVAPRAGVRVAGYIPACQVMWQSDPDTQNVLPPPCSRREGANPHRDNRPITLPNPLANAGTRREDGAHAAHSERHEPFQVVFVAVCAVEDEAYQPPLGS
jgi:hypothetical protein